MTTTSLLAAAEARYESAWLRRVVFALVAVLFLWPSYGEWKMTGVPNLAPPRLIKLLLFTVLAYNFVTIGIDFGRIKNRLEANWVLFSCLLLFNLIQFATFAFDSQGGYWIYKYIKETLMGNILILFALLLVLRNENDVIILFKVLVISSLGIGLFSIAEFVLKYNFFRDFVSDANLSTVMALSDKTRDFNYRVSSVFIHPLVLANYAICILPIAILLFMRSHGLFRLFYGLTICSLLVDAVLSSTRSGIVIAALTTLVVAGYLLSDWWRSQRNGVVKALVLLLNITIIFVLVTFSLYWFSDIIAGRTYEESRSTVVRLGEIEAAIPKILDSPLVGYGPTDAATGVGLTGAFGSVVDNYYLLISLQSGLLAALILLITFVIPAKNLIPQFFLSSPYQQKPLAALAISFSVFLIFQSIHALPDLHSLFYVLIACFAVLNSNNTPQEIHSDNLI